MTECLIGGAHRRDERMLGRHEAEAARGDLVDLPRQPESSVLQIVANEARESRLTPFSERLRTQDKQ